MLADVVFHGSPDTGLQWTKPDGSSAPPPDANFMYWIQAAQWAVKNSKDQPTWQPHVQEAFKSDVSIECIFVARVHYMLNFCQQLAFMKFRCDAGFKGVLFVPNAIADLQVVIDADSRATSAAQWKDRRGRDQVLRGIQGHADGCSIRESQR